MTVKKGVQGQKKPNVQAQIKALQRRCKLLEYDIIDIRLKLPKAIQEPRQIGFIQHSQLHTDNEFDEE